MSVKRCQQEVDGVEFLEWMEYWRLDPFGEERADHRAGIIASVIANVNRASNSTTFRPQDFMPTFGAVETPSQAPRAQAGTRTGQTPAHMLQIFRAFTEVQNQHVGVPSPAHGPTNGHTKGEPWPS